MNKDKQIEEMAKSIYNLDHCEGYKDDRGCMYAPSCSVCKYGRENKAKQISELLANHGYRKAEDVASEIFEEFRNAMRTEIARNEALFAEDADDFYEGRNDAYRTAINCLAELKKKYESEKE